MIFYFSGTGNSRYVARRMGYRTLESLRFIPSENPSLSTFRGKTLGLVFPVYSWGVPPLVLDFIRHLNMRFVEQVRRSRVKIWAVMTCGDDTGKAPEMLEKALAARGLTLSGIWSVQMPNNYVLLPGFDTDPENIVEEKLEKAPARVDEIASWINEGVWLQDCEEGKMASLKTRVVYPLFKKWGMDVRKWKVSDKCIGCGRCEKSCPMKNIWMKEGRPAWNVNCVSCLACYHVCPVKAINYGGATKNKGQYNKLIDTEE